MLRLRPYQDDLLRRAKVALAPPRARTLPLLPTGAGKTRIASALLAARIQDGGKGVWPTHRRELSAQTGQALNHSGVRAANTLHWRIDAPAPSTNRGVIILMAQTMARRNHYDHVWAEYDAKDLLVIDEAHHADAPGWQPAIQQWPCQVIGLTATPWRLAKDRGFNHLFDNLILATQIRELQLQGYLAQAQVLMPDSTAIIVGGQVANTGDYNESGIELANPGLHDVMTAGALEFWRHRAQGRQTIVYAVGVKHAENLAAVFNDAGFPAAVILGDTPPEIRRELMRQFSDGRLKVLVNVEVTTEGVDLPDAACVVLARPTMSLALYLQMVGRGLRPKPDGGNCLLLNLAGNVERFYSGTGKCLKSDS